ncbi:MAG: hypothetical protein JSS75_13590 [Bacteroidetes bacterium]|nr:hypothetical protein [Bacteroidota bacterium]
MRRFVPVIIAVLLSIPVVLLAQKPERQISFAREMRPHSYYVQQAELWARELAKDSTSEDNWYNYFRACRNAYGSANWKSDFVNESRALKMGPDILAVMKRFIPSSFTYHYLLYLDGGIIPDLASHLLTAYAINPDFEGICSSMISYAVTSGDGALRKEVNKHWYPKNEIATGLMTYAYNVLMSLDTNAILLTQSDNDTYPLWMLQDALGIRTDVRVINVDFMLIESYRDSILHSLDLPNMPKIVADPNVYQENWHDIVAHCLKHYNGKAPLYVGMTLFPSLIKDFQDQLTISGLAYRLTRTPLDLSKWNVQLYEKQFLLDNIRHPLIREQNQGNVDMQNLNYIDFFTAIYADSMKQKNKARADELRSLSISLVTRMGHPEWEEQVEAEFDKVTPH